MFHKYLLIMKFLRKFFSGKTTRLSNQKLEQKYLEAGKSFGDAVSYLYMGECIEFKEMLDKLAEYEKEYAKRGYKTISIDDFVKFGGYGEPINHLLGKKLEANEAPRYHSEIYRDKFLGKVKPIVNLQKILEDGEPQSGNYQLPSTEED